MPRRPAAPFVLVLLAGLAAPGCSREDAGDAARSRADAERAWIDEWTVPDSFSLARDARGFSFPTSIVFVPEPGPRPRDPLYFVSELRGTLKVVANDRSVHVFADDVTRLRPRRELPLEDGEVGFGAVCLDPAHGYVFATYVRRDEQGLLRNEIARFETTPGTFALGPSGRTTIAAPFARDEASISHQIGHCQVDGDLLYVGVGDGYQTFASRNVDTTLGKILRMTLDGGPAPANPFAAGGAAGPRPQPAAAGSSTAGASGPGEAGPPRPAAPRPDDAVAPARAFVWAYGFRNPFSLRLLGGRLFAADNGPNVDRLIAVERGADYLWDGTDWSVGTGALSVMPSGLGSAQLTWAPAEAPGFAPDWPGGFILAAAGHPNRPGAGPDEAQKGVFAIPFDSAGGRLLGRPEFVVKYRGTSFGGVAAAAPGPDGLYFAPLFPHPDGDSPVMRLRHDPAGEHPHVLSEELRPVALMEQRGCVGCHDLYGYEQQKGAHLRRGPPLEPGDTAERIAERLASPAYAAAVRSVDGIDAEPYRSWAAARREVLAAEGEDRVRTWIVYHVMEPRFDNPASLMPNLGVSRREAAVVADYLMTEPRSLAEAVHDLALGSRVKGFVDRLTPWLEYRALKLLGTGFGLGILAAVAGASLVRRRRRRPR